MDKFPGDLAAEIRQLRAEVDELKALLRQQAPLTSASAGWKFGNMASPPTPSGGGHLFASGGNPLWKTSSGTVHELITPRGIAVANPANTLTNATPSYVQGQAQTVVNSVESLFDAHNALVASLRAAPLIAT